MKTIQIAPGLTGSCIAMGCMRIGTLSVDQVEHLIDAAMESGISFFDHADIYAEGRSEEIFGQALQRRPGTRKKIILQTKCGICNGYYDFSAKHIAASVDGSLKRLQTDYLDVLLLHRPDALMEPEEVAQAFEKLHKDGKVRYFGVSNQNPMQIELLKKAVTQPLVINQLQFGVMHTGMIDSGFHVNMADPASVMHDGSVLEYCRLHDITLQAWSPFQYGFFEGVFLDNAKFPQLNACIAKTAQKYGVTNSAIATAWILRHPAKKQVVTGTTSAQRLLQISKGADITLTREEWYEIYRAAGNALP